jgi:hypothetical protein
MASMMFPDTSNDQQLAAIRHTAERSLAVVNSRVAREHETRQPIAPMREGFNACPHSIGSVTPLLPKNSVSPAANP